MALMKTDKDLLREIAEYRRIIEDAEAELEVLKKDAIMRMKGLGVDELKSDEHKATYKAVTSNRFDSKAFKADGYEELYKEYSKPQTSMRFNFT